MKTLPAAVLVALLASAMAGCAGSGAPKGSPSPSISQGSATVATDPGSDVGSISGNVSDNEATPIANATVGIVKLGVEVHTTAAGAYTFSNVPVGEHDVAVTRLGYENQAKRVTVKAGEEAHANFVLAPIAIKESFPEALQHKALHHLGVTQYLHWAVNLTTCTVGACQEALCESCSWSIYPSGPSDFMFFEDFGVHTFTDPQTPEEFVWAFQDHYNGVQIGKNSFFPLPGNVTFTKEQIGAKTTKIWLQILCDEYWVCFEESRDVWVTLFHNTEEIPDGYSARPKA